MNYNKARTILLASLIAGLVMTFITLDHVNAEQEHTIQDLKNDMRDWINNPEDQTLKEKTKQIKTKYDQLLQDTVEQINTSAGSQMNENEKAGLVNYMIMEIYKGEKLNHIVDTNMNTVGARGSCPATTDPSSYSQVTIDIEGGSYGTSTFEGGNRLYQIIYSMNHSTCEKTFVLFWEDEDHPNPILDEVYDLARIVAYDRIEDVEMFTIQNNEHIIFDNTWSDGNDYDCLENLIVGCHASTKKSYSGGTIYVANTWNHMMDTSDTNPTLDKTIIDISPVPNFTGTVFTDNGGGDNSGNGMQDAGEAGIGGYTMYAIDRVTEHVHSTVTASDGSYSFGIVPGNETLVQTGFFPEGHTVLYPKVPEHLEEASWFSKVTLSREDTATFDVGFYPVPQSEMVTLDVVLYEDTNVNYKYDEGEPGVEGINDLYVYTYTIGPHPVFTTDANGMATIGNLVPADFSVLTYHDPNKKCNELAEEGWQWASTTFEDDDEPERPVIEDPEPGSTHVMKIGLWTLDNCDKESGDHETVTGTVLNEPFHAPGTTKSTESPVQGKSPGGWTIGAPEDDAGHPTEDHHPSNTMASASNCTAPCELVLPDSASLAGHASATLSVHRYVDDDLAAGEYLRIYVSPDGGTTWDKILEWNGDSHDDDTWYHETYDLEDYLSSTDLMIKAVAKMAGADKHVMIDDVVITVTDPPIPAYFDHFDDLHSWSLSGDSDWEIASSHAHMPVPLYPGMNTVANANHCDTECIMTLNPRFDTSGPLEISFMRFVDGTVTGSDGLYVQYSADGTTWTDIAAYTGDNGANTDEWHDESITLYIPDAAAGIRFLAQSSSSGGHMDIDELVISPVSPFVTTWTVIQADLDITIPGTGTYIVDWGDGSMTDATGAASHTYDKAGTYTVTIAGGLESISLGSGTRANAAQLASIEQWGDTEWTSMENAFRHALRMTYNATDSPDLSGVTDMKRMFWSAFAFDGDISDWDVSGVTDMKGVFDGATSFDGDISDWDTSNVTDMSYMFRDTFAFDGDISDWDVSGVTDMSYMFFFSSFDGDISGWDVSGVTDMSYMFQGADSFDQNLGEWYIVPSNRTVSSGDLPGVVGTISAQNTVLDGHGPTYAIGSGGDSSLFSIVSGNELRMASAVPGTYTVTITATGTSVFEDGNNELELEITVN